MYKNVFYFSHINDIGGVETMFYELAKKYKNWDITIVYSTGAKQQINRLRQFVRVEKLDKAKKIECEKAFFNYSLALDYFNAKEYWQIIHADYVQQKLEPHLDSRMTGYIAVSNTVAKSFKQLTGIDAIVCYNPITIEDQDTLPVLNMLSATRLTKEKGKGRMAKLAERLNSAGVLFNWDIYTNDREPINIPGVYYKQPTLNIRPYIANADLVVQLSDSEGWCYTINEAMCLGVPVLSTPCPSIAEMDGEVIYLNFDLSNLDEVIERISKLKKKRKSAYKPKKDIWDKLLVPGKSTYYTEEKKVRGVAVKNYFDIQLQDTIMPGDINYFTKSRADELVSKGLIMILPN